MTPQLNRIFTRSLLGAVLVLFLLPFTTLTCGGAKLVTMNGVQWEFGFWMALLAALAGAVVAFIGLKAPGETNAER